MEYEYQIHGFGVKTNGGGIGFSYSEIRFLNKNIVKYLKINAIFARVFFQLFFCLAALQITQRYIFMG